MGENRKGATLGYLGVLSLRVGCRTAKLWPFCGINRQNRTKKARNAKKAKNVAFAWVVGL